MRRRKKRLKIDINKDFEEAFPNELYSGFTLGQCLAAVIGLAMAASAAFLLWKYAEIPIVDSTYITIPLMVPACAVGFYRYQGQSLYVIIREFLFFRKTQRLSYASGEYTGNHRIFAMKHRVKKPDSRKKRAKKKPKKNSCKEGGDESWQ